MKVKNNTYLQKYLLRSKSNKMLFICCKMFLFQQQSWKKYMNKYTYIPRVIHMYIDGLIAFATRVSHMNLRLISGSVDQQPSIYSVAQRGSEPGGEQAVYVLFLYAMLPNKLISEVYYQNASLLNRITTLIFKS